MEKNNIPGLIKWSMEGNPYAREELVRIAQSQIYYHCLKMLKHEQDALDATQDILLIMLTSLDKLRDPKAFWGWINAITANHCKHILTRRGQVWQIPEDDEGNSMLDQIEDEDQQQVPDQSLDNQESRRMIMELIDDLPPEQRMCVLFYYYDEMSVKQIAQVLEIPEGTVKSRLNYARKAIKAGVEKYEKQGVKLYGLSPIPFLLYFLRMDAQQGMGSAVAQAMAQHVVAMAAQAGAGGAAASAGGTAAASGQAAAQGAASGGAAAGSAAAASGAASGISAKVIAGVLAGVILLGGGAVLLPKVLDRPTAQATPSQPAAQTASPTAQPTPSAEPTPQPFTAQQPNVVRTELTPPIAGAEVYFEIPVFEDDTGGYAVINEFFRQKQEEFFSPSNQMLADLPEMAANNTTGDTYFYATSATVYDCTDQIFSVSLNNSMYFGGVASGEGACYTFDPKTGEQLSLSDLVDAGSVEDLKELIIQGLLEEYPGIESREDILTNVRELDYSMDDFKFYVKDGQVWIDFDKYEIADGASGIFSVPLPLSLKLPS